jgi:hypothetical protein
VPRQQVAADEVTTDYVGTAVERVQQLRWAPAGWQQSMSHVVIVALVAHPS